MHFSTRQTQKGFTLSVSGKWRSDPCEIRFPEKIWQAFPGKQALINELAYVCTLATPLMLKHDQVWYDTPVPQFIEFYHTCFESTIPNMVEPVPGENAYDVLEQFQSVTRHFPDPENPLRISAAIPQNTKRVVLPFTFGKDSLLSMVLLQEMGYEVIPVFIDERILPKGLKIRKGLENRFRKEFNISTCLVENELQLFSEYEMLGTQETRLYQVQIYFVYLFAMLPFCIYYQAPFIVFSNEYHHSLDQVHKQDLRAPHRVMQTLEIDRKMAQIMETISSDQVTVASLINGLGNFAIHSILHELFPEFGKYRLSCNLELSPHEKWCHECYRCAHAFIFFLAHGKDPFEQGFVTSMLGKNKKKHFSLFKADIHPDDQYHKYTRDQELLGFLMACQNGAQGPLMDDFKNMHLKEAVSIGKKLKKKYLSLQKIPGQRTIEKKASSLIKSKLTAFY